MDLRVGVIGVGRIGEGHVNRVLNAAGSTVVAVADANVEKAAEIAKKYSIRSQKDALELIKDEEIDAVIVTSWDASHEEYVLAALNAGKYVFCEKPLAATVQGCINIMEKEAKVAGGKRLVQVGYMRRYDEPYIRLKNLLDSGTMGAPLTMRCIHYNKFPGGEPPTTHNMIRRMLVHEIDVLRWLLGEEFVSTQVILPRSTKYAGENLKDPEIVLLSTKSGTSIYVELFQNSTYAYEVRCEITCENGMLYMPEPMSVFKRFNGVAGYDLTPTFAERFPKAFETEIVEWVKSVNAGMLTGPSAWDGYVANAVIEACENARDTGKLVKIELIDRPSMY